MILAERSERFEAWVAPMRDRAAPGAWSRGRRWRGGAWFGAVTALVALADQAGFLPDRGVIVVFLLSFAC
jgi:hypothetical protein